MPNNMMNKILLIKVEENRMILTERGKALLTIMSVEKARRVLKTQTSNQIIIWVPSIQVLEVWNCQTMQKIRYSTLYFYKFRLVLTSMISVPDSEWLDKTNNNTLIIKWEPSEVDQSELLLLSNNTKISRWTTIPICNCRIWLLQGTL